MTGSSGSRGSLTPTSLRAMILTMYSDPSCKSFTWSLWVSPSTWPTYIKRFNVILYAIIKFNMCLILFTESLLRKNDKIFLPILVFRHYYSLWYFYMHSSSHHMFFWCIRFPPILCTYDSIIWKKKMRFNGWQNFLFIKTFKFFFKYKKCVSFETC